MFMQPTHTTTPTQDLHIEQLYDQGLAHASYAILSQGEIALVDPGRDPQIYYDFARKHEATIVAVIETHPHADFVSAHQEIAQATGAKVYVSGMVGAEYEHVPFDEGSELKLASLTLLPLNTPGHSPDSISVLLKDDTGKIHAVFTGDTLFIGDVGRPDLREKAGNMRAKREELARQMYHSTRDKLMTLPEDTLVYPAHGAGSLCGKNLSDDTVSTIGRELKTNYALQPMSEEAFVDTLLQGQPFIPKYFGYAVDLNKNGAPAYEASVNQVAKIDRNSPLDPAALLIDTRPQEAFKAGHLKGALNIPDGGKFETWLGSLVGPEEKFYLLAENEETLDTVIRKAAKIGYEALIVAGLLTPEALPETNPALDLADFRQHPDAYTIVDIRNASEHEAGAFFAQAVNVPLPELRERAREIDTSKPVVVHCAGGYRSAAGSSILEAALGKKTTVYDLSEAVNEFS
jgi:hydroxyacylglutathione hydrolase